MRARILLGCALAFMGAAAAEDGGQLYGTVMLRDGGEVSGALRWDGEEVLWIHHFNGRKAGTYDLGLLPARDREAILDRLPGPQLEINGHVVELARWLGGGGELKPPQFGIEFGAIAEVVPGRHDRASIRLRDGSVIEAEGGSNDLGEPDIEVLTGDGARRPIDWDDIERIHFEPAPDDTPRFPPHLYGRVETEIGAFEGFVEWDNDERRADQRLDGEVDGVDEEIEFGSIRSIAKEGPGSRVVLVDGVSKLMTGTNDVNSENRGIVVTGPAFGQVDIPWSAFQQVTFSRAPTDLPRYTDFAQVGPLRGTAIAHDGARLAGEVVFDLDQAHQGETLEGRQGGVLFRIPLRLIAALEPQDQRSTRVELRSGGVPVLGVRNDVTEDNNGLVVRAADGTLNYLPWSKLKRLELDP